MKKPTLDELNSFIEIAHQLSFSKAADNLGVSRSALSHVIKGLEQQIGVQLFRRTTRSVSITEHGERLLTEIVPLLHSINKAIFDISNEGQKALGNIRINGSEAAIRILMKEIMPLFHQRFPDVAVDSICDGELTDIIKEDFDAGIRLGDSIPKDMIAVRLSDDIRFLTVAAPKYFEDTEMPHHPKDLYLHQCIRQRLPSGKRYRWDFDYQGTEIKVDPMGFITLDNNQLMVEAAIQGMGIAYVPESYAKEAILGKTLTPVLQKWCSPEPGFFLYFPRYSHMNPALRALIDIIKQVREQRVPLDIT